MELGSCHYLLNVLELDKMDRAKRIWYLSLCEQRRFRRSLAHTSSESRGTFRQKARSLAPLNGWACAVKICNDRMLEDTNSLDGAQMISNFSYASTSILDLFERQASVYLDYPCLVHINVIEKMWK